MSDSIPIDSGRPGYDRPMHREEINVCPVHSWEGEIVLIRDAAEAEDTARELAGERVLGFDTETRPTFHKGQHYPPALLQLAGAYAVYIFQLKYTGLPVSLQALFSNPDNIKAGVSLQYDLAELQKITPFRQAGFVDLALLAKKQGIKNHGLRGLAAVLLGIRISKSIRTSNWARDDLSPAQIRYAATDAWIGRELYLRLNGGL